MTEPIDELPYHFTCFPMCKYNEAIITVNQFKWISCGMNYFYQRFTPLSRPVKLIWKRSNPLDTPIEYEELMMILKDIQHVQQYIYQYKNKL